MECISAGYPLHLSWRWVRLVSPDPGGCLKESRSTRVSVQVSDGGTIGGGVRLQSWRRNDPSSAGLWEASIFTSVACEDTHPSGGSAALGAGETRHFDVFRVPIRMRKHKV